MNNEQKIIEQLKVRDHKVLSMVYEQNRPGFILFAKKYQINDDDIVDIYQEAIIALCENASKGLLDHLKASLTTYLFGIGKFLIFKLIKKNKQMTITDQDIIEPIYYDTFDEDQSSMQVNALQNALKKIGPQCQQVLKMFYFEEKKLDEIMIALNYSNKDVLKSQKSRCIKQLKEMIKNDR
jgi:RNA polymerase sigma factor (sigma-70 family)